jgi:hypothetical protein
MKNSIESASAFGDASHPKPSSFAASLRASATPFKAPSLSFYKHPFVHCIGVYKKSYSIPFVDGTPFTSGLIALATRNARPNPLKIDSIIW